MGILSLILSWFGGGPLGAIIKGLNQAHSDSLNAKTVEEKTASQERIAFFQNELAEEKARLADVADARQSAKTLPWWMAVIAALIGLPFGIHVALIGIGTWWVSPGDYDPLSHTFVNGTGWLEWTRHIPPFPVPFDTQEMNVIGFFFGFGAAAMVAGAGVKVAQHIAGAVVARRRASPAGG